jgi:hypothetical protein
MSGCPNNKKSINCTCTYPGCSRHGKCCECVEYHRGSGEVPGCFFSPNAERTYDRSIEAFINDRSN